MQLQKLHKIVGIALTIPLLAWALTGIIFLTKPGYSGAYERLPVKTYPLEQTFAPALAGQWHEAKLLRTVLGYHLLLKGPQGQLHLDPRTLQKRPTPTDAELTRLVTDAIRLNPQRYGDLSHINNGQAFTDSNVEIALDWQTLSLSQSGSDTRLINTLYKIHYLQWLGEKTANTVFGALGIFLLLCLVVLGVMNSRNRGA
ncbi:MAG: hypothetical protein ACI9JM_002044 [Halioglobus sp.]|jgi:hypothetical protein